MRLIDADAFKEYICNAYEQVKHMYPDGGKWAKEITEDFCKDIDEQPTIDISNNSNTLGALDCVERRLVSYKLTDLVNEFEEILSHIREREENDSVCGLCEYDGAYMGQSGDWCNECPGFDKADCFKLKDKYKKEWLELMNTLPSAQTEIIRCTECKHYREYDSKYVENAVVVQCMADRYPISETIPDGWFCAGAERRTDE